MQLITQWGHGDKGDDKIYKILDAIPGRDGIKILNRAKKRFLTGGRKGFPSYFLYFK